jgi:hypothetical protein
LSGRRFRDGLALARIVVEDNRSDDDGHGNGGEGDSELGHDFLLMWRV